MFELYLFIIIITLHLLMENNVWCFIIVYYAEGSKTWSLTKDIIKSSREREVYGWSSLRTSNQKWRDS